MRLHPKGRLTSAEMERHVEQGRSLNWWGSDSHRRRTGARTRSATPLTVFSITAFSSSSVMWRLSLGDLGQMQSGVEKAVTLWTVIVTVDAGVSGFLVHWHVGDVTVAVAGGSTIRARVHAGSFWTYAVRTGARLHSQHRDILNRGPKSSTPMPCDTHHIQHEGSRTAVPSTPRIRHLRSCS